MAKRKILMITPYLPRRSQSGGQTSSYYSIKYLSNENDITLISFSRDEEGLEEIKQYCSKVIIVKRGKTWDFKKIIYTGFSTYPFLVTNYISSDLKAAIKNELDSHKYDLIHCECFYLMPNITETNIPIVLVDQTIEYAVYQHYVETLTGVKRLLAPLLWLDVFKLKFWEIYYWKNTHTVTAFSSEDQAVISKITGRKDIKLFQNGVDKRFYESVSKTKKSKYPSVLFGVSNMKWMQNREAAELLYSDIWPKIKEKIPNAKLYIIGRNAPETYGQRQNEDVIIQEAQTDGEAHDPQYYYNRCWVLVAPIGSGGGSRNKFFEAMACRLPIITTPQGMGGIKIENFKHAIVCQYDKITQHTIKLLKDQKKRNDIGKQANLLIKNNYSYEKSAQGLNQIYHEITNAKK
jgi:glycosyltransferase involved in cell wall biosynthesis